MNTKTIIFCTTSFEALHRFVDAPEEVSFLRDYHRHMFHVRMEKLVTHNNRQIEFIILKRKLDDWLRKYWTRVMLDLSCEEMAAILLEEFDADMVEVSEDGELGGRVIKVEDPSLAFSEPIVDTEKYGMEVKDIPISMQKRTKCFRGIELEGPHAGKIVLFIPGSVTKSRFDSIWDTEATEDVERVYFGAGNDLDLNMELLGNLLDMEDILPTRLDIECQEYTDAMELAQSRGATIISRTQDIRADYHKIIEEDVVKWIDKSDRQFCTALDDPGYKKDRYVE